MIISDPDTWADKWRDRKRGWYRWFAWKPVELRDGRGVWLQLIERQRTVRLHRNAFGSGWVRAYDYRLLKKDQ